MSLGERGSIRLSFPFFIRKTLSEVFEISKLELKCEFCGNKLSRFPSEVRSENVFCDRECWSNYQENNRRTEGCTFCGKSFTKKKSDFTGKNNFCSKKCKDRWQIDGLRGPNNPFYKKTHSLKSINLMKDTLKQVRLKGELNPRYNRKPVKCEVCGEISLKIPYLIDRSKNQYCSRECRHIGQSEIIAGVNNPNYNPQLSEQDREKRIKVLGYIKFKNSVLRRDEDSCALCKSKEKLVVHHLNSYHWDKENRLNPKNGITLCCKCHQSFHKTYGYKFNTKKQFEEFAQASI